MSDQEQRFYALNENRGCYRNGAAYPFETRQRILHAYDELDTGLTKRERYTAVAKTWCVSDTTVKRYVKERDELLREMGVVEETWGLVETVAQRGGSAPRITARPACPAPALSQTTASPRDTRLTRWRPLWSRSKATTLRRTPTC